MDFLIFRLETCGKENLPLKSESLKSEQHTGEDEVMFIVSSTMS